MYTYTVSSALSTKIDKPCMRAFFQLLPVTRVELDNVGRELRVTRKRNGRNEYEREAETDKRFHLKLFPMEDEPRQVGYLNGEFFPMEDESREVGYLNGEGG